MHDRPGLHPDERLALMASSGRQTLGLALGIAIGFGVVFLARSKAPNAVSPPVPEEAAAGPAMSRPLAPPRPAPKFPASLDMFVTANKRTGTTVADGGDGVPRVPEGKAVQVVPVRSPAADRQAEEDMMRREEAAEQEQQPAGEPDRIMKPAPEPRTGPAFVLRLAGGTALALVLAAYVVGFGRSGDILAGAALIGAVITGILSVAARGQIAGNEPAGWLGVAAFAAIVAFSRFGNSIPSGPTAS